MVLSVVAVLLASVASAQSGPPKRSFRRYTGPVSNAELDLETGVVTRGASVRPRAAATSVTFPNLDLGGFVGADTARAPVSGTTRASRTGAGAPTRRASASPTARARSTR